MITKEQLKALRTAVRIAEPWLNRDQCEAALQTLRAMATPPIRRDAKEQTVKTGVIELTPAEIQSGLDRVRWAELLILQLPTNHDGRNSWLLNYGRECVAAPQAVQITGAIRKPTPPIRRDAALKPRNVDPSFEESIKNKDW